VESSHEPADLNKVDFRQLPLPGFKMAESVREAIQEPQPDGNSKTLGAYYTDAQVAEFLVWWAIRSADDRVLDPSFGGGVFLRAACKRLRQLGGNPSDHVFGVEIDERVHASIADKLFDEFAVRRRNLILSSCFDLSRDAIRDVNVVVGNPPFIRYHRFSGDVRRRALARAEEQGVRLSELSSSWAPFLVHSSSILSPGGRLAMVVPAEIGCAAYARPILEHLSRSFGRVYLLTFQKKLFPELNEDTVLLLAEDKGSQCSSFRWRDLSHAGELLRLQAGGETALPRTRAVDAQGLQGRNKLIENFIPVKTRDLYRELKSLASTSRLDDLADVGIGYVTGANAFFHVDSRTARTWQIPASYLRAAVRRSRDLTGLRFTRDDWQRTVESGEAGYLLHIESADGLPEGLRRYLKHGESRGVPTAFKCRTRSPWFRVPHVYRPDAFLTYMSGLAPRLVANETHAVSPNTLHIVRARSPECSGASLAALWHTALTAFSVEIEGHALGGGMLKLEPSEAENVVLAAANGSSAPLMEELDRLVRSGREADAQARADQVVLRAGLGLTAREVERLRQGARILRERRCARS
jgi:adenine-specific DNA-methyltransferase